MRKFAAGIVSFVLVVLLSTTAFAAIVPQKESAQEGEFQQQLPDGTIVKYKGVKLGQYSRLWLTCSVTTNKDMDISIGKDGVIYDQAGNKFEMNQGASIGGTNTFKRDVIEGIETLVEIMAYVDNDYKPTEIFPRVRISVNGKMIEFRNVPLQSQS